MPLKRLQDDFLAISAVNKSLFTLLGHMSNFVYKSRDKNYTRRVYYALKRLTRRFFEKLKTTSSTIQQIKSLEGVQRTARPENEIQQMS